MKKIKLVLVYLFLHALMGCSVTSLQCGVDGDSSYVNLTNLPANQQDTKNYAALCNFNVQ